MLLSVGFELYTSMGSLDLVGGFSYKFSMCVLLKRLRKVNLNFINFINLPHWVCVARSCLHVTVANIGVIFNAVLAADLTRLGLAVLHGFANMFQEITVNPDFLIIYYSL